MSIRTDLNSQQAAVSAAVGAAGSKFADAAAHERQHLQPNSGADHFLLKLVKSAAGSLLVRNQSAALQTLLFWSS